MKSINTTRTLLAGAALAGIMTGGFAVRAMAATSAPTKATTGEVADDAKPAGETHDCAGKNGCKGKGGCKSGDNGCAGKNGCKGKGGCAMKDGKPKH